eukprot:1743422-Rhodomonas_salina.1
MSISVLRCACRIGDTAGFARAGWSAAIVLVSCWKRKAEVVLSWGRAKKVGSLGIVNRWSGSGFCRAGPGRGVVGVSSKVLGVKLERRESRRVGEVRGKPLHVLAVAA